jgi:hypothetical protein
MHDAALWLRSWAHSDTRLEAALNLRTEFGASRGLQVFIEDGEPRVVSPSSTSLFGERRQMNAVEASQAVLLGELARGSAQGIGGFGNRYGIFNRDSWTTGRRMPRISRASSPARLLQS